MLKKKVKFIFKTLLFIIILVSETLKQIRIIVVVRHNSGNILHITKSQFERDQSRTSENNQRFAKTFLKKSSSLLPVKFGNLC